MLNLDSTMQSWSTARPRWTVLFLGFLASACTTIQPTNVAPPSLETTSTIRHHDLSAVHREFVDEQGRVDYQRLKHQPGQLERYYLWLSLESPETSPERFPDQDAELAYWLNAYNTAVLVTVTRNYPVQSVTEIGAYPPLNLVNDRLGFFVFQRIQIGGREINLRDLRESIIRTRYKDPRIHFALNYGTLGSPRLPKEAFRGEHLHRQLDHETRRFFADSRNLRFDHDRQTVAVSAILGWYREDFTQWLARTHPGTKPTLLEYVALYAPPEHEAALLRAREEGYSVEFLDYDWGLNDRGQGEPAPT